MNNIFTAYGVSSRKWVGRRCGGVPMGYGGGVSTAMLNAQAKRRHYMSLSQKKTLPTKEQLTCRRLKPAQGCEQGSSAPGNRKWCLYITIYFSINHRSEWRRWWWWYRDYKATVGGRAYIVRLPPPFSHTALLLLFFPLAGLQSGLQRLKGPWQRQRYGWPRDASTFPRTTAAATSRSVPP